MSGFTFVDGPFGGTPETAANLNAIAATDANVSALITQPLTAAQLNATYAQISSVAPNTLDGGNATSVYTGTFNFDGGSAT